MMPPRAALVLLALFLAPTPSLPCHVMVKGIATVLRENVVFSRREMRQSLNEIIHCPTWHRDCRKNLKHHQVLFHPESLAFMVTSGMYRDVILLGHILDRAEPHLRGGAGKQPHAP